MNMKVGEPIDHKHGWSFNSKTKQYQVWNQFERLDPEHVLITNPSPILNMCLLLTNVFRATTACTFLTSQLPKVV